MPLIKVFFLVLIFTISQASSASYICSDLASRASYEYGLIPETNKPRAVVLGHYEGQSVETVKNIARAIPEKYPLIFAMLTKKGTDLRQEDLDSFIDILRAEGREVETVNTDWWGNVWVRDWVPQAVRGRGGIQYYGNLSYTMNFGYEGPRNFAKDTGWKHKESEIDGQLGNVMVDRFGRLFATDYILEENADKFSKGKVIKELKSLFQVREVHILKNPPQNSAKHIDMFAKYLGNRNGEEVMLVAQSADPKSKKILDEHAQYFEGLGFKVVRMKEFGMIGEGLAGFVNSLQLENLIIMPTYSQGARAYAESSGNRKQLRSIDNMIAKLPEYEEAAKKVYEDLGFQVVTVDSFQNILKKGSIHCLTCAVAAE